MTVELRLTHFGAAGWSITDGQTTLLSSNHGQDEALAEADSFVAEVKGVAPRPGRRPASLRDHRPVTTPHGLDFALGLDEARR
jgi:hypothetical protein